MNSQKVYTFPVVLSLQKGRFSPEMRDFLLFEGDVPFLNFPKKTSRHFALALSSAAAKLWQTLLHSASFPSGFP
ncbi:hypothetical protein INF35_00985 [Subdoligranulum sp. DSM 109015]|uniref:Uncharacterized protein n=1 Tax=Gemmiger gallinarum TaxID=2779354 RepID=A0ABR9QZS3_9FIRM|nr:hypothetical protein [Gemmiger gallinarum]